MEIPINGWIFGGAIVGGLAALVSVARGENDLWHAVGLFLLLMAVALAIGFIRFSGFEACVKQ